MSAETPPGERPDPVDVVAGALRRENGCGTCPCEICDREADTILTALHEAGWRIVRTEDAGVELAPGGVAVTGVSPPPGERPLEHNLGGPVPLAAVDIRAVRAAHGLVDDLTPSEVDLLDAWRLLANLHSAGWRIVRTSTCACGVADALHDSGHERYPTAERIADEWPPFPAAGATAPETTP